MCLIMRCLMCHSARRRFSFFSFGLFTPLCYCTLWKIPQALFFFGASMCVFGPIDFNGSTRETHKNALKMHINNAWKCKRKKVWTWPQRMFAQSEHLCCRWNWLSTGLFQKFPPWAFPGWDVICHEELSQTVALCPFPWQASTWVIPPVCSITCKSHSYIVT